MPKRKSFNIMQRATRREAKAKRMKDHFFKSDKSKILKRKKTTTILVILMPYLSIARRNHNNSNRHFRVIENYALD